MIIALSGAHRTGKTTVFELLRQARPNWTFQPEPARIIAPVIDFSDPQQFISTHGIAILQAVQISLFAALSPSFNPGARDDNTIIVDRTPYDYLAYYDFFCTPDERKHADLLVKLASHFMQSIDGVIYFPCGAFELSDQQGDPHGVSLQNDIDQSIKHYLQSFPGKFLELTASTAQNRLEEAIAFEAAL